MGQTHDVGQVQFLKLGVVRDVEKNGLDALASAMPSYRRPLAREVERFLPALLAVPADEDLPLERLDVLRGDGEFMI